MVIVKEEFKDYYKSKRDLRNSAKVGIKMMVNWKWISLTNTTKISKMESASIYITLRHV